MNKKLNNVIEKSLKFSKFYKDKNIDEDEEAKFSFEAARDKAAKEIYEEIRSEVRQEEIDKAQEEIKNTRLINKIKDFKILTITSVFIAFFIGMAVNQITNFLYLFNFFKKWYGMFSIFVLSVFIIVIIIGYIILKEIVEYLLKRGKNERDNSK